MRIFAPVAALLLSTALLLLGNGLQNVLVPVRAEIEEFSTVDIGIMGSAFFVGFVVGCLYAPRAVRRAGHIRAFSALASLASITALSHVIVFDPITWWIFRAVTGLCFAGLYVVIESWLNERATNATRGLIFSAYTMIYLLVITIGQLMITLDDPGSFRLFALASIMVSISVIPVALTMAPAPTPITTVHVRPGRLFDASPVGVVGCFAVGLVNGTFWALAPLYATASGFDLNQLAYFLSGTVFAGGIMQLPLGRVSDRTDRRRVILIVAAVGAAAGAMLATVSTLTPLTTMILAFVFGGAAFPLYALCVAHTNDHVTTSDFVEISSGLLLTNGLGSVIGPLIAAPLMDYGGAQMLFAFTASVHVALALYTAWRMTRNAPAPEETREEFVVIPRTAPTAFEMDPRSEDEPEEPGHEEELR